MTNYSLYSDLSSLSLSGSCLDRQRCLDILTDPSIQLLPLLQAAFDVRQQFFAKDISIHIINNAKNGHCPEDCHYCVQAKTSDSSIKDYPMKSDKEILAEAKVAYESGAFRYCMVFSGRGPSKGRVKKLCSLIERIKSLYPIQICLSPGLIDDKDANMLKEAGLDRLNHNLNTSETHYKNICSTHSYQDRLNTLYAAQKAGLETCSGLICGMQESHDDIIDVALKLRQLGTPSIPVNFYIPLEGAPLKERLTPQDALSPDYCLRVLCLIRFLNPKAEVRIAAGREMHLRMLQPLAFYPANSIFMDGYLNTAGSNHLQTLELIKDAGFKPKTDFHLDTLLNRVQKHSQDEPDLNHFEPRLKDWKELHPTLKPVASS